MSLKKKISKTVVFVSVFAGTLISEGISLVTISEPGKKAAEKIRSTVKNMQTEIHEQFHIATAKIIEESSLINSQMKRGELAIFLQAAQNSFKDSFANAKAKYDKRT